MEVLKPDVYWIGSRCYRVNPGSTTRGISGYSEQVEEEESARKPYMEVDEYEDEPGCNNAEGEGEIQDSVDLIKEENGFKAVCTDIPSSLFPQIVGSKGSVKKRIEYETSTRIFVPRPNEKGDISVRGQKEKDVRLAFKRLTEIAANSRFKRDITHFACFSMNTPSVIEKTKEFKDLVLKDCGANSRGLSENIFQEAEKLHLTISAMVLLDERERKCADEILKHMEKEIKQITQGQRLKVHLKGLDMMNDDPSQVNVLYAKCEPVDESFKAVQLIADEIAAKFSAKGLAKEKRGEKVKLHCTVINTRFRNADVSESGSGRNYGLPRESFDARPILQKFGGFDFGIVEISEVKIATRHSTAKDGFYKCYATLSI